MDREILSSVGALLDGLSDYLGSGFEFVLHSFEDLEESVVAIINGHYSNRRIGSPITDLALKMFEEIKKDPQAHPYKSYFNRNRQGTILKCTTIPIKGENGRYVGLLCINFYTDQSFLTILSNFLPSHEDEAQKVKENFSENTEELIIHALEDAKNQIYNNPAIAYANKNKEIIHLLYDKGIFNLKEAVLLVTKGLNISKNTVYLHLRNYQKKSR
ncbi:MAG: PAS domain-containing protein [Spirochaetales bacterium]|nr:PAS domain-containing protein [Spirochaetales bacterium]